MDDDKRKTIVNEIDVWRRGKLLPEQYCDFLQNLYLDDLNERPKGIVGAAVQKIGQASVKHWLLVFVSFALICIIVLHFSAFPAALQIAITGIVTAAFTGLGAWLREKQPLKGLLWISAAMIFLPVAGLSVLVLQDWDARAGPAVLLGICALVWICCGVLLRLSLLHAAGWVGLVILYGALLSDRLPDPSLLEVQIFWLPAALLFGWLSWFLHVRYKPAGSVFFALALILWFMPEVYSALLDIHPDWIQLQLLCKIAAAGVGLFRLRKQWMEWVA
ncbi:hypothetical protein SD71_18440 [Cohnella kolymensis]|uniref:DUF2157 domain-containing protein n=1 Tax=Cohnella kolymensis TaxID=1590652 RepID=A0ABR5A0S6_9BACL|nr:hypothetical protein SD71_18440 [Cohnella kolymensis]